MYRVVNCVIADKLPHAGGLFDQPAAWYHLHMTYLGYVSEHEQQMDRERQVKQAQHEAMIQSRMHGGM